MTPSTHQVSLFARAARWTALASGKPVVFMLALAAVMAWLVSGPLFHFSDTWQLVINTSTTIVTFLMIFLVQNTQNRDTEAIHVKLDELIRATAGAHNALLDLEELEDTELDRVRQDYRELARRAREDLEHGRTDKGTPGTARRAGK